MQSQQAHDIESWKHHVDYLEGFLAKETHASVAKRLDIKSKLERAKQQLTKVSDKDYLASLSGTIGRQPI